VLLASPPGGSFEDTWCRLELAPPTTWRHACCRAISSGLQSYPPGAEAASTTLASAVEAATSKTSTSRRPSEVQALPPARLWPRCLAPTAGRI